MIAFGPFRKLKAFTAWIIPIGSVIFTTGTGVFVTFVTSPFMVLKTVPAVGAMNVAIFSYFCSGFQYGVGLGYESGPLFAFITTAWTIGKELNGLTPADGSITTGKHLAIAMLVFSLTWIVHSISYRLFGYRVDWRRGYKRRDRNQQDPRFQLGAAQGHPTWRTPMGQSTSVIMTALSWSLVRVVKKDLEDIQKCRPDWVFQAMLYVAPILISFTIVWNIMSGIRCRTVSGEIVERGRIWSLMEFFFGSHEQTRHSDYPGLQSYKDLIGYFQEPEDMNRDIKRYRNAVALQRMGRNTMFGEQVPDERLGSSDKVIGFIAWLLAQGGLMVSFPGFCSVWLVAELLVTIAEYLVGRFDCCKKCISWLVKTEVTPEDRMSAAKVIELSYVGADLSQDEPTNEGNMFSLLEVPEKHRSVNLNALLEGTGPAELYDLLSHVRYPSNSS